MEIEALVERKNLTERIALQIEKLAPFGMGNKTPILATKAMKIDEAKVIGGGKHLKLRVDGIDCIYFGKGELINTLNRGQLADVAYKLEFNRFNGREALQLNVKNILTG